ncbi:MAG: ABC transporter ATP-binding protein [Candidatus Kapabacteria bacterium]|nr:ABC transporter ATP-binding protein [Candidatus Kapabacteria bacterium]
MKTFFRVLKFVRPFIGLFFIAISFNILFALLSTVFIAVIHPVLQILFNSTSDLQLTNVSALGSIKDSFYASIRSIVLVENQYESLLRLCVFIISLSLIRNITKYISSITSTRLNEKIIKNMKDTLFSKISTLSMDFYTKHRSGELISILNNDVGSMHSSIDPFMSTIFRNPVEILLLLALLLSLSPWLTFVAFSTSFVGVIVIRIATKYIRKYAQRIQQAHANSTAVAQETIYGIRTIKSFSAEKRMIDVFKKHTTDMVKDLVKVSRIQSLAPSINDLVAIISLAVVLYMGGSQVFEGTMNGADVMQFLFALFAIMSPISGLTNIPIQIQRGIVSAERVFKVLDTTESVKNGSKSIIGFNDSLVVSNVSFEYREHNPVLKNISLELGKSKKIALVGASGSGKSTMLDLLIRFYDPNDGTITIDGENIKNVKLEEYRSLFGVVSQEAQLFNDSIRNNILFGSPKATDEEIISAAKLANAHSFITELPDGYDSIIGDRGIMLSGGQKQRLSIARALVANPQILLFDEATSALDSESEKLVQDAINTLLIDRSAIVVAHRLSTILSCDCIYVFENGSIVEHGTHSELIEIENGVYKNLYSIQFAM